MWRETDFVSLSVAPQESFGRNASGAGAAEFAQAEELATGMNSD